MTKIGLLIKEQRTKMGLSQDEAGHLVGVCGQFISNIERGFALPPRKRLSLFVDKLKINEKRAKKAFETDYLEWLK